MDPQPLTEALNALSQFLVAEASVGDTLHRVAAIAVDAITPSEFAGITMLDEKGKPTTGVFTDEASPEIDSAQYDSGRGPCLDAWRRKQVIRLDDLEHDGRDYPEFSDAAIGHGIKSTLSLPLIAADQGIGALNLYAKSSSAFSTEHEELGFELATAASVVMANSAAYWGARELSEHLNTAMQSRAVIEQAKGILMAQSAGLDADGAFDLLVKASQRENLKLRDIAQRIVERRAISSER